MENIRNSKKNFPLLILMSSITLMAILCELMPTGFLPQIGSTYGISISESGKLVGAYAVASAIFGIPIISYTVSWDRKKLLFILLMGFAIANIIVGIATSFKIVLVGRLIGGMCAGTLWPMITAYGMKMVEPKDEGKAVTIIMSGITVGMSVGLPFMTWLGTIFGYKVAFIILGVSLAIIAIMCNIKLPNIEGEKRSKKNSPLSMLKHKGVLVVIILTFLGIAANYGLYTFITNLVSQKAYPGVAIAQIFIGIGSVISVIITMRYIDEHLNIMVLTLFALGAITFFLFYITRKIILIHFIFFLWGLAFGSLSSVFQTATARQVTEGTAVANALQSSSFNFSIMLGSTVAGMLLDYSGIKLVLIAGSVVLIAGLVVSILNKEKFIKKIK